MDYFAELLLEAVGEDKFHGEDREIELSFVRTEYVFGMVVPLLENFDEKRCLIRDPGLWSRKIQKVFGTNGFGRKQN